jgi:hypothetical protein
MIKIQIYDDNVKNTYLDISDATPTNSRDEGRDDQGDDDAFEHAQEQAANVLDIPGALLLEKMMIVMTSYIASLIDHGSSFTDLRATPSKIPA